MPGADVGGLRTVLEAGRAPGAGRWRSKWATRLAPLEKGTEAGSSVTLALARSPAVVESRDRTVWWLDGDALARRISRWKSPQVPEEVHRILVTSEAY